MAIRSRFGKAARAAVRADGALVESASEHQRNPAVRGLAWAGEVGDQGPMRILCAAVAGTGVVTGSRRLLRSGVRMLLAHELATLAKDMVKVRIDRTRPRSARSLREREPRPGSSTAKELSSFPSGHSSGAIAAARAFSREFPEYRAPAIGAAAAVAAVQVPSNAHYASDVAAGLAIGIAAEALVDFGWRAVEERLPARAAR